jgi:hypothetical protein
MPFIQKLFSSYKDFKPGQGSGHLGELYHIWYDSESNSLRISDGVTPGGKPITSGTGVTVSNAQPVSGQTGSMWYDTEGGRMYVYYANTWVDSSPALAGPTGPAGPAGGEYSATRRVTGNSYICDFTDYYIGVNHPGAVDIVLIAVSNGKKLVIKDESQLASINNIHIRGTIDSDIDGAIISIDGGVVHLIYNDGWRLASMIF